MDRFWSKVDKTGPCWLWTASVNADGYGRFRLGPKVYLAHRVSWTLSGGAEPQRGDSLDHLCRVRACVRPSHLELVSVAENNRRGLRTKLTWEDVEYIRVSEEPATELAKRFGVTHIYVRSIRRNEVWRNA